MSSSTLPITRTPPLAARRLAYLERALPLLVFAAASLLLFLMYGNRLILSTNDEGIFLDAAQRILHGQRPYADFFGYMSPGSFWMQALAFRLEGVTLAAGRLPALLYLALECALVYWLVARLASRGAAAVTTLLFFAFQTSDPSLLTAQHRWDSSALALASIVLAVRAQRDGRRFSMAASGVLIVLAALATPSVALVALVTVAWLLWTAGRRESARWYLLGLLAATGVLIAALTFDGILLPLVRQIAWLSRNYSEVNVMPYGAIIGGYHAILAGAGAWELPVRLWLVVCIALPALLPILAVAAGGLLLLRRRDTSAQQSELGYLLLCVLALAASTYPRMDVAHLSYIAPLPYALAGILAWRSIPARPRAWFALWMALWGAVFFLRSGTHLNAQSMATPVGAVRVSPADAPAVGALLSRVHPHDTLFVYPYKPLLYFLTQAENPTRYSYLAPGMMTAADATLALRDLERDPPAWMLYLDLAPEEFARVFPAEAGASPHFAQLEAWIKANYMRADCPPVAGYQLLQPAQPRPAR